MRLGKLLAWAALIPMAAPAAPPLQLQPSGPWILDYGDDSCRLIRSFGEGKKQATIVFERSSPRSTTSLLVLGSAVSVDDHSRDVTGEFRPVERSTFKDGYAVKSVSNLHDAILWQHVGLIDPGQFPEITERPGSDAPGVFVPVQERDSILRNVASRGAQVQSIAIAPKHHRVLELRTGPMAEAMEMLDQCTRDELPGWGIDPKIDAKIVTPARPINMKSWFSVGDYPEAAMRRGIQTSLQFRVNVDANGRVTDCHIITDVKAAEINEEICKIIRSRARFEPAELADGTKVPDYFGNVVVFRMQN